MTEFKYDVYIAGAMHGRLGRDVLLEREIAKLWCKWYMLTYYDPAEDEQINPDDVIDSKPDLEIMKWYVEKDDAHVDQCQMLLVLTGDISSAGTAWEMGRMHYRNLRPVVVVSKRMFSHELTNFTTIKATHIEGTIDMALKWIFDKLRRDKECHI